MLLLPSPETHHLVKKTHPGQLKRESVQRTDLCSRGYTGGQWVQGSTFQRIPSHPLPCPQDSTLQCLESSI